MSWGKSSKASTQPGARSSESLKVWVCYGYSQQNCALGVTSVELTMHLQASAPSSSVTSSKRRTPYSLYGQPGKRQSLGVAGSAGQNPALL